MSEVDDTILEKYLHGQEIPEDEIKAALRKRTVESVRNEKTAVRAGHLRLGVQEQGRAAAARRGRRLPAVAARHSADDRHRSERRRGRARPSGPPTDDAPLVGAGVQDHDRPVRRSAHVHPRVLRRHDVRHGGLQRDQAEDRAHRPPAEDAREQARGNQGSLRGRHRRGRRPEVRLDRRHGVRREEAGHPRSDGLPGAGHLARDRAEDEGRPGKARHGPRQADGRGPDVPRQDRHGNRPGRHRRHGRAAPRDHRRPPEARVQRRGDGRQAAGRLQGNDHAGGRGRRPLHQADRRPRPVRPREDPPDSAQAGRGLRVRERDRRRHRFRRNSSSRSTRASARR